MRVSTLPDAMADIFLSYSDKLTTAIISKGDYTEGSRFEFGGRAFIVNAVNRVGTFTEFTMYPR